MRARRRAFIQVTFLSAIGLSTPANAAFEGAHEVVQPLVTAEGIYLSTVSFVLYTGHLVPGFEVSLVGKASWVTDGLGRSVNRNVANLLGIKTGYDPAHDLGELCGDTLRVFIDLSEVGDRKPPSGCSVKGVVEATVEAVLTTASQSRTGISPEATPATPWSQPAARRSVHAAYVQLEIRGAQAYAHLGGVFSFDSLGALPRRRRFQ